MWPYIYEPRSKIDDYDDQVEEQSSCLSNIWLIPIFPVVIVVMALINLTPFIAIFIYYLSDVYKTTKKTIETGEISYPLLAQVGIFVFIYLLWMFLSSFTQNDLHLRPATLIAIVFVFNHTLLPYAAFGIFLLRRFFGIEFAG